jgi:hypothetical protein
MPTGLQQRALRPVDTPSFEILGRSPSPPFIGVRTLPRTRLAPSVPAAAPRLARALLRLAGIRGSSGQHKHTRGT